VAKQGFLEKGQQKRKVAVYNRKSILEPPEKRILREWGILMPGKKRIESACGKGDSIPPKRIRKKRLCGNSQGMQSQKDSPVQSSRSLN